MLLREGINEKETGIGFHSFDFGAMNSSKLTMKWLMLMCCIFVEVSCWSPEENIGIDDNDLVEGDIIVTPDQKAAWYGGRAAIKKDLWPGAVMVYDFHQSIIQSPSFMQMVKAALQEWEQKTCIRFKRRTTEYAYAEFRSDTSGCSSFVGKIGTRQRISLGPGCGAHGIILHEIGHALGFHHEQNRPDREDYVTIAWDNIMPRYKFAFKRQEKWRVDSHGTPYDYKSIMHYGSTAFSMNGKKTIIVKQSAYIGQRRELSVIDAYEASKLYKCPGTTDMPFATIGPPRSEFTCTFDAGSNCGFIQLADDNFDWSRGSNQTPSSETGPDGDHTTGTGVYMFIEASDRPKGYLAKMTKKILLTGKSCLSFYYNMYGVRYMGSIKVLVQGKQVFEMSGDQGKGWKKAEVKLQGTGVTELEFHGIAGGNFRSDAAIDDVSLKDCQQETTVSPVTKPTTTTTAHPPLSGFKCNFDVDLCGFTQETNDDYDWTRLDKPTPTWDSGPNIDHTSGKGFYLYTEASGLKQGNVAILSKNIDLSGNTCLKLFYHMHGQDMGTLRIIVGGRTVFEKTGPQGNSWNEAKVRLPGNGPTKLSIHGVIGKSYRSDAGIDDVSIEECSP